MRFYIRLLLVFIVVLSACKKENGITEPSGKTELQVRIEQIRHKWMFDKFIHHETVNTQSYADTVLGGVDDYFEFRDNNRAYSFWDNVHDTVSYLVFDKSHILYGGDTFKIQTLDATQFVFTNSSATDTSTEFNEIRLSK